MVPQILRSAARSSCVVGPLRLLSARSGRANSRLLHIEPRRFYKPSEFWTTNWRLGADGLLASQACHQIGQRPIAGFMGLEDLASMISVYCLELRRNCQGIHRIFSPGLRLCCTRLSRRILGMVSSSRSSPG